MTVTAVAQRWTCFSHDGNDDCTRDAPCFDCATALHDVAHAEPVDDCRECKLRTLIVSTSVGSDTRTRRVVLGNQSRNSWEKGIAVDERGMPLLEADGSLIPIKKYAEKRSRYDEARRRLRQDPHVFDRWEH